MREGAAQEDASREFQGAHWGGGARNSYRPSPLRNTRVRLRPVRGEKTPVSLTVHVHRTGRPLLLSVHSLSASSDHADECVGGELLPRFVSPAVSCSSLVRA